MSQRPDPYKTLGLARRASAAQIRRRYHDLAMSAHPDVVGEEGLQQMLALNAAWEILGDKRRRAEYDAASAAEAAAEADAAAERQRKAGQPEWTGAAGPPPGRPAGSRLEFGLYAGWTLGEIARTDPGYLRWLSDRREAKPFAAELSALLEQLRERSGGQPQPQPKRRWGF